MEILRKGTVSEEFSRESPETLWKLRAFLENFHTGKVGEITVFHAVNNWSSEITFLKMKTKSPSDLPVEHIDFAQKISISRAE